METIVSQTAEISLDVDLVHAARSHGVDVRAAAEAGVRLRLEEQIERETDASQVRAALDQYATYAEEHGSFADAWRSF